MKIYINEQQEKLILKSFITEGRHKTYGGTTLEWLKKHEIELTDEEKSLCKERNAVWSSNEIGVHKGTAKDKTIVYFSYTHRAWSLKETLKQAIKSFEFIESTS